MGDISKLYLFLLMQKDDLQSDVIPYPNMGNKNNCNTNKTYIDMSSRHLITRVREHLNFKSLQDSAIKDHILSCGKCSNNQFNENNFITIRKCKSIFCSKIHEALLIKN